MKFYPGLITNN